MIPICWSVTPRSLKKFIDVSELPVASIIDSRTSTGVTSLITSVEGAKRPRVLKVKFSRYRPGVAHRVGRGIALLFYDRGTRRGCVVSSTPRPHFNFRKRRGAHFTRGWVGPRTGLGGPKISSTPRFDPAPSSP